MRFECEFSPFRIKMAFRCVLSVNSHLSGFKLFYLVPPMTWNVARVHIWNTLSVATECTDHLERDDSVCETFGML